MENYKITTKTDLSTDLLRNSLNLGRSLTKNEKFYLVRFRIYSEKKKS